MLLPMQARDVTNHPGNVEARVMCFYRRAEIPSSLVPIADKHHWGEADMEQVYFGWKLLINVLIMLPGL